MLGAMAAAPADLGDGLVLRTGRPGDEDAIVEHVAAAFSPTAEQRLRARLDEDGGRGVTRWCTVWDGARLVSSSGLLAHRLAVDGTVLAAGQIEWVVTDPGYQRRGLVRRQLAEHHRRARAEGMALTVVDGIPYLYRKLGWGYALDWPAVHAVPAAPRGRGDDGRAGATTWHDGVAVRPAVAGDETALVALDDLRPDRGVHVVRDRARWSWWIGLAGRGPDEDLLLAEARPGRAEGWARVERDGEATLVLVRPGPTRTLAAARALLARARAGAPPGWGVEVVGRPGPWAEVLATEAVPLPYDHGVQARVVDPVALLTALVPVLDRRLAEAGGDVSGPLDLSLYERTVRLELDHDHVVAVGTGPRIEDPFAHGDVGIAPDLLPALVLGRFGAPGLAARADDVTLGRHTDLVDVLFPARPSDVVTDL